MTPRKIAPLLLFGLLTTATACKPATPSATGANAVVEKHDPSPAVVQSDPPPMIATPPAPDTRPAAVQTAASTGPSAAVAPAPPAGFDPADTLPYLASDALEGRGVGTHGLDEAADFLSAHFAQAGLAPLPGQSGYFQEFDYTAARVPSPDCSLSVAGRPLKLNDDYRPMSFSAEGQFSADVVFAGYGITSAKHHYDDYAGLDVAGKVVLVMRFEPMNAAGKSLFATAGGQDWSEEATFDKKAQNAAAHGAAALVVFTPPALEPADPLVPFAHAFRGATAGVPVLDVKRTVAAMVLGGDPKAVIQFGDGGKPQPVQSASVTATGRVAIQRTVAKLKNVVGVVRGSGPLAEEYVVVGAHYDHLGKGQLGHNFGPVGSIYHGADDNASGTAAVLSLASKTAASPPRNRSVIFALFSAEEEGLIGSNYFVAHPSVPLEKIAAMLNLDMVGRVKDNTIYVGGSGTARDFDPIVQSAAKGQPLVVKPMPATVGGRGGLGPSDHMSFALKKIPVLFLFSGLHADYHRPTDVSAKVNYAGVREVVDLCGRLVDALTTMPKEAYDSSADSGGMAFGSVGTSTSDHTSGAALGVIPDYSTETSQAGVLIQGARPGSAAANAGLQAGDILVSFGDKKLEGLQDLADCLFGAKPGDKVTIKVQRGKQSLDVQATLTERKG